MFTAKSIFAALGAATVLTLTGCATTEPAGAGNTAATHNHMRDAKQGTAYPAPAAGETTRKPLHDHREMK